MYERFTDRAHKVMQLANQEAQRFNHEHVGTEHILLGLVKEGSGVAANVLKNLEVDLRRIRLEVEKIIQPSPDAVTVGKLPPTPRAKAVIEYALEEARDLDHNYVGTEHLLLGLLREQDGVGAQILMNLGLKLEGVRQEVLDLLGQNLMTVASGCDSQPNQVVSFSVTALDRFGRDLTELARKGKLDPCIGRDSDLDLLIRIFGRRSKNRPLLLGEAGVGKSALVRGLAHRLEGLQPGYCLPHCVGIRGHRLVSVDLPAVVAGATKRGQVSERIRTLAAEARTHDAILFLDDFHLWADDRPALLALASALDDANGGPCCLAATAPAGLARLAEQVSTLGRLFRPMVVSPPPLADVFTILHGLRDRLEAHHRVCIKDGALQAAVEHAVNAGSGGRGKPPSLIDRALDFIDEAAAYARLRMTNRPPDLRALDGEIEKLNKAKEAAVAEADFEKAAGLRDQGDKLRRRMEAMTREWREKTREVDGVLDEEAVRDFAAQDQQRTFDVRGEPF